MIASPSHVVDEREFSIGDRVLYAPYGLISAGVTAGKITEKAKTMLKVEDESMPYPFGGCFEHWIKQELIIEKL